ncbi:MAG: CocE/NonD family hydrolase [Thermoplasmatota archaeon]
MKHAWMVAPLLLMGLAGCLSDDDGSEGLAAPVNDDVPFLGYEVPEPDMALELIETSFRLPGAGVELYTRVVRPVGEGPFPVVAQFTPYTAPGENAVVDSLLEPAVGNNDGRFDTEFVRRGYAFAYADVRGTGSSDGCLNLRGQADIDDVGLLAEWLGTQPWSNGKVGFIGASYPGSEAHMAALSGNEHVAAVVPIVASTSFYHYHHNDGVPYRGQHSLGGTNTGYTTEGVTPTLNPDGSVAKLADQPTCPHVEHAVTYGGTDQTGTYDAWWMERNLRARAANVTVPVLMAQGLADWNVKPDHVATWFNALPGAAAGAPKTFIGGQWGHAYPEDAPDAYGEWWAYAAAFFDTHVKGVDTGMFQTDVAWVQDTDGDWHRSSSFPLQGAEADHRVLDLHKGTMMEGHAHDHEDAMSWNACASDRLVANQLLLPAGQFVPATDPCSDVEDSQLVWEWTADRDMMLSGVPLLHLDLQSDQAFTHLVAVLEIGGERQNYGYLNPTFRNGLDAPEAVPTGATYSVTIDFYPQEDLISKGQTVRLLLGSDDDGRTIEAFDDGVNTVVWGDEDGKGNRLFLPLRPAHMEGVRLG